MKFRTAFTVLTLGLAASTTLAQNSLTNRPQDEERLSFQANDTWIPRVNVNSDIAMAYGIDKTLPDRLKNWKEHGYIPQVMTGVAWGEYQDFLYGRFDGVNHEDAAQQYKSGEKKGHGGDVYYMCPTESYGKFLSVGVGRALDAGATGVYLEEPEFWVATGWEPAFKKEWQDYYHEAWIEPDSSPDAQYRASKLKYYLYRRALGQVFDFVKQWSKEHGKDIKCYVPTHSMINYANWGIVSPESSLLDVGCDGYIAQVWTGTARTPNVYEGVKKERTFETAFLEYGSEQNLVRASGRRMWYLNDPIEDNANHSWHDYKTNWESTLVASLLQPEIYRYEIMPWPHRIFTKNYPVTQPVRRNTPRVPIPKEYETELQAVISAMGDMKQEKNEWLSAGTKGVGVLVADTMMFQRFGPHASDPELGSFYGLSLPFLMRGIPVEAVQMETAELKNYKTLVLTYEGQKPVSDKIHTQIAEWVKDGGALVVIDDDKDPFLAVREWWNTGEKKLTTPRLDLFEKLGLAADASGLNKVGKGVVVYAAKSPAALSHSKDGANTVRDLAKQAMDATGTKWEEANSLVLKRGPYIIAGGLEQPVPGTKPVDLNGRFIPLFSGDLPTMKQYHVVPGVRAVLVDVDAAPNGVIAAACRTSDAKMDEHSLTFNADGLEESRGVVCAKIAGKPTKVTVGDQQLAASDFEFEDGLLRIRFTNKATQQKVVVNW